MKSRTRGKEWVCYRPQISHCHHDNNSDDDDDGEDTDDQNNNNHPSLYAFHANPFLNITKSKCPSKLYSKPGR
jgi:hypothetical protein